jgi:hypothetical protein
MAQLLSAVSWAFWSRLVGPPLKLWFIFFILWWKWRIVGSKKIGHLCSTRNQRQTLRAHQQQILHAHEVLCTTILIGSWIEYLSPHQIVLRGWHSPMWVPLIHGRHMVYMAWPIGQEYRSALDEAEITSFLQFSYNSTYFCDYLLK